MSRTAADPLLEILDRASELVPSLARPGATEDEQEDLELIVRSIETWARNEWDSLRIDQDSEIPAQIIQTAREMGLFGLTVPQEYGGAGFSMKATAHVMETMARFDRSVATTIGLHAGLGLRGLIRYGSRDLKERYLPGFASGEHIAAFATTEVNAGSEIAAVATTGTAMGANLLVNGSKIFVTNGGLAGRVTIFASTPGLGGSRRGKSLILIPLDLPGVQRDAEEHKMGIRGTSTRTLHFSDLLVPADHVVGTPGKGADHIASVLCWGRTLLSAGSVGMGKAALQRAVAHATLRVQFGRPIAQFGMSRERIARMAADIYAAQSLVRLTTLLQDLGRDDIAWESCIAKTFATEMAWDVADGCVQLHGGMGFIEETGVSLILRDARIGRIFEGANELLRFHVGTGALSWRRDRSIPPPALSSMVQPELAEAATRFDWLHSETMVAMNSLKRRLGVRIFQHQALIRRLADAFIPLLGILATVLRTEGERFLETEHRWNDDLLLCQLASRRLLDVGRAALAELDADDETLLAMISDRQYELYGSH